jgi:tRNA modification GTPase
LSLLITKEAPDADTALLTNLRQQQVVSAALAALVRAHQAAAATIPHEMILLDLYEALQALDALTGSTTSDDILNLIFSKFCIGK